MTQPPSVEELELQYMQQQETLYKQSPAEAYATQLSHLLDTQLRHTFRAGGHTLLLLVAPFALATVYHFYQAFLPYATYVWLAVMSIVGLDAAWTHYRTRSAFKAYVSLFFEYHSEGVVRPPQSTWPRLWPRKATRSAVPGVLPDTVHAVSSPPCVCNNLECCGACTYEAGKHHVAELSDGAQVWTYSAILYSGDTVTRVVSATDGDAAKRLGRASVELGGERVQLHGVREWQPSDGPVQPAEATEQPEVAADK